MGIFLHCLASGNKHGNNRVVFNVVFLKSTVVVAVWKNNGKNNGKIILSCLIFELNSLLEIATTVVLSLVGKTFTENQPGS